MYAEAKKKHLIEELLHVESEDVLNQVEEILDNYKSKSKPESGDFTRFLGVFSVEEANEFALSLEPPRQNTL